MATSTQVRSVQQDMIAILNADDYTQLFALASPMQVTIREIAKTTSFQVEDGTERTDHIVFLPTEIDIPLLLTDERRSVFANIKQAWRKQDSLIVQTKIDTYSGLIIYEMPHEESAEQGDSVLVQIKLKVIEVITPEYGALPPRKVENKSQASTVKKGQQQTTDTDAPTKRRASVLAGLIK